MEESKKSRNILIIILVILLFISVGIICYLLGVNSVQENNKNKAETNIIQNEDTELNKENNKEEIEQDYSITPVNYQPKCLDSYVRQLEQSLIVDIDETKYNDIIEYIKEQKNVKVNLYYCSVDGPELKNHNYQLTTDEKNIVFNEIKNSIYEIKSSEIGGTCIPGIKIAYERNNKEYFVDYYDLFAMFSNDGNIYKILDKSVNNTLSTPQSCLYYFNNLSATAQNLLNNLKIN